jgi:hypothetical protein
MIRVCDMHTNRALVRLASTTGESVVNADQLPNFSVALLAVVLNLVSSLSHRQALC